MEGSYKKGRKLGAALGDDTNLSGLTKSLSLVFKHR